MQTCHGCHSVSSHTFVKETIHQTSPVGHTSTHPAPCSLPCCSEAHCRHLPTLLGPATAVNAIGPSHAGNWACRHLPASTTPGTCRPRHFAQQVPKNRRAGGCRHCRKHAMPDVSGSRCVGCRLFQPPVGPTGLQLRESRGSCMSQTASCICQDALQVPDANTDCSGVMCLLIPVQRSVAS